ncbi:MAG: cadherin-like domain-containing protein [Verrucomicrobiales bacterium]|nr:cadherin-like domain-containing protein [Verrucomicrobiales bacterium]
MWRGGFAFAGIELVQSTTDAGGGRGRAGTTSIDVTLGGSGALWHSSDQGITLRSGFVGRLNEAPSATARVLRRSPGLTGKISSADLLAGVTDPENDAVSLLAVGATAAGGALIVDNGWILYLPTGPVTAPDSFPFEVVDAEGGWTIGTVYIVEEDPGARPSMNHFGPPVLLPDGSLLLRFLGIAGRQYVIEFTADVAQPWQPLFPGQPPQAAAPDGVIEVIDLYPGTGQRFYRTVGQ